MRRQITRMVEDVISLAQARLEKFKPGDVLDVRRSSMAYIMFSDAMIEVDRGIKRLLYTHVYRHPEVMRVRAAAASIVTDLYRAFLDAPELMGGKFWSEEVAATITPEARARLVADYLAGMTDTFAVEMHGRLFDRTPELR